MTFCFLPSRLTSFLACIGRLDDLHVLSGSRCFCCCAWRCGIQEHPDIIGHELFIGLYPRRYAICQVGNDFWIIDISDVFMCPLGYLLVFFLEHPERLAVLVPRYFLKILTYHLPLLIHLLPRILHRSSSLVHFLIILKPKLFSHAHWFDSIHSLDSLIRFDSLIWFDSIHSFDSIRDPETIHVYTCSLTITRSTPWNVTDICFSLVH